MYMYMYVVHTSSSGVVRVRMKCGVEAIITSTTSDNLSWKCLSKPSSYRGKDDRDNIIIILVNNKEYCAICTSCGHLELSKHCLREGKDCKVSKS